MATTLQGLDAHADDERHFPGFHSGQSLLLYPFSSSKCFGIERSAFHRHDFERAS